ncbi:hypothetical protein B0T24DRAFT_488353, partial [Lasiosphaeria ovina]
LQNATTIALALAEADLARRNATIEEIEARGIRPNIDDILAPLRYGASQSLERGESSSSIEPRKIFGPREAQSNAEDGSSDETSAYDGGGDDDGKDTNVERTWHEYIHEAGLESADLRLLQRYHSLYYVRLSKIKQAAAKWRSLSRPPAKLVDMFDLIGSLSTSTYLLEEVCTYLYPTDILRLYSISRDFHHTLNCHMSSCVGTWARRMAPNAFILLSSPVYNHFHVDDPAGNLKAPEYYDMTYLSNPEMEAPVIADKELRKIPGLGWLQMVVNREIRVRDILATLARMGHRMPKDFNKTLLKLWLIMDVATTAGRNEVLANEEFFTDLDLYFTQQFFVKLCLCFNNPVYGPHSTMMMKIMMGQKGLSPLWALLRRKKYTTVLEAQQLKIRYDVVASPAEIATCICPYGVPYLEMGILRYEGWGAGAGYLVRPDEAISMEAARRNIDLDDCIYYMMIYGHVDISSGRRLVPTLDEMYMSDEEELSSPLSVVPPLPYDAVIGGCGNASFERFINADEESDWGDDEMEDGDKEDDGDEED